MTQEEKVRAYDKAFNVALETYKTQPMYRDWLEKMFHELKESDDERIRKAILELIKQSSEILEKKNQEQMIDWLERQGEQKFADNVGSKYVPEFHEGDWVFIEEVRGYKNGPFQIKTVDSFGYSFDEYHTIPFMYEELLSKWTIQDAKAGDVLTDGDMFVIFKSNNYDPNTQYGCMFVYCSIMKNSRGWHESWYESGGHNPTYYLPATKEQCDTLMKAMADAGWEFDFEKKELKKIEYASETMNEKGAIDNGFTEMLLKEQKPVEWSEEDKEYIAACIEVIDYYYTLCDKLKILTKINAFRRDYAEKLKSWLKSLRPQKQWKPSDEQIQALVYVFNHYIPNATDKIAWNALQTIELMLGQLLREE